MIPRLRRRMIPLFASGAAARGGAVAWVPTDLGANLIAWYKADTGIYKDAGTTLAANGETVQQWNDQSVNGYHLKQGTSGNRPQFLSAGFNSKQTVKFTAATPTSMATDAASVAMGTGAVGSAFFVGQMLTGTPNAGRAVNYMIAGNDTDTTDSAWLIRSLGGADTVLTYRAGSKALESISLATNYRLGSIFDGTNDTIYINNVAGTPVGCTDAWGSPGQIGLSSIAAWDGPISEVVITKSALSVGDRSNLDDYFKTKWGL